LIPFLISLVALVAFAALAASAIQRITHLKPLSSTLDERMMRDALRRGKVVLKLA
jgi:hypothetical protein